MSSSKRDPAGSAYISSVTNDGIVVITIDYAPVNALSVGLRNGLTTLVRQLEGREANADTPTHVTGIVIHGAGRCFCAGADISAFGGKSAPLVKLGRPFTGPFGFGLEDNTIGGGGAPVPVVAAIHGYALGGGLELALACHYRVIAKRTMVGLPEVNIGLLPGGQGTQRLPRLIGAEKALDFMLSGKHISAGNAVKLGIADKMVAMGAGVDDLVKEAVAFCREKRTALRNEGRPPPSVARLPCPDATDFAAFRSRMRKKRPGEIAPEAIIKCVEAACAGPSFAEGKRVEQKEFMALVASPESKALRHVFTAERGGRKLLDIPRTVKPRAIQTVGIVGAGLMGGGIAMCCANAGMAVTILDISEEALQRGLALVEKNYARSRSMSAAAKQKARARITGTTSYDALAQCDMVVEAVFESLDIKLKIFQKLDQICKPAAFLCSNTSALDVDAIAMACSPDRRPKVMGTHFFSPANVMKLLENVRGAMTSEETIVTMMKWGARLGKWVILAGNCAGFVGNRMLGKYSGGAAEALAQGVLPEQVDAAALSFGMRMGPFAMADLVGLDLGIQAWKKAGTYSPATNPKHALIDMGRKGLKTKSGYYDYSDQGKPRPSPVVEEMLRRVYPQRSNARSPSKEEVTRALFMPMINEGFYILEEGMAQRPGDIDICYIYGYNFPKVKGGPMFYADEIGLQKVKETLLSMGIKPAGLLEDCISQSLSLAKYWKKYGGTAWKGAKAKQHYSRVESSASSKL